MQQEKVVVFSVMKKKSATGSVYAVAVAKSVNAARRIIREDFERDGAFKAQIPGIRAQSYDQACVRLDAFVKFVESISCDALNTDGSAISRFVLNDDSVYAIVAQELISE